MKKDYLNELNAPQLEAVKKTEGPVLILAGAGSGKTRVLTYRVAYLIEELGVNPRNILAITFTNKAAGEMRDRIEAITPDGLYVWVSTFHSTCVRMLRQFADRIGYSRDFVIYDSDDQKTLMKDVLKRLDVDPKRYSPKLMLSVISGAKNNLVSADEYVTNARGDYYKNIVSNVYLEYQKRLRMNNAMDFDDLILNTALLLQYDTEVRSYYQNRFHYIMVDEYQDTNHAQFELVRLLASGHNNLCVVGDDDQSIYAFRGANIYNILNFEEHFKDTTVIKLEQNYRSTSIILDAANGVIKNNNDRKDKALWTDQGGGEKIHFEQFDSGYEEASFISRDIARHIRNDGDSYNSFAVLYRTNAQSRAIEEQLIYDGIPYKLIGGVNFYSRKEVKDIVAYLKIVASPTDDISVARIINVPKRGIGATTVGRAQDYAVNNDISLYDALCNAKDIAVLSKSAKKIDVFVNLIEELKEIYTQSGLTSLVESIIDMTGYIEELELKGDEESLARIENIEELISKVALYENDSDDPNLSEFLEEISLVADIDSLDETEDYVTLMTLHSAKGLEFNGVYIAGVEEGLFPSFMSIASDESDKEIEEERRLFYVGVTRARQRLAVTCAKKRMLRGEIRFNSISRFVKEIPENLIDGSTWEPTSKVVSDDGTKSALNKFRESTKRKTSSPSAVANLNIYGTKIEKKALDFGVGDTVSHIKFGQGVVLSVADGGKDYEVSVDFEKFGVKKMFASFAKLQKV